MQEDDPEKLEENNDLETRMIFGLADLLKSYDAEHFYGKLFPFTTFRLSKYIIDLAERLYKNWDQPAVYHSNVKLFTLCLKQALSKQIFRAFSQFRANIAQPAPEDYPQPSIAESNEISVEEPQEVQLVKKSNYKVRIFSHPKPLYRHQVKLCPHFENESKLQFPLQAHGTKLFLEKFLIRHSQMYSKNYIPQQLQSRRRLLTRKN